MIISNFNRLKKNDGIEYDKNKSQTMYQTILVYHIYRSLTSSIIFILFFFSQKTINIESLFWNEYFLVSILYVLFSFFMLIMSKRSVSVLTFIGLCIDIVCISYLNFHGSSSQYNLGILLVVVVAAGGIIYSGRFGTLIAALSTLSILISHFLHVLNAQPDSNLSSIPAGFLGLTFFITSLFSQAFSKKLQESELRASKQENDIMRLKNLNELIIQRMRTGIMLLDLDGKIIISNQSAYHLLGLTSDSESSYINEWSHSLAESFNNWLHKREQSKKNITIEKTGLNLSVNYTFLDQGETKNIIMFIDDASKLHQEAQTIKLASIGRLAASIAHEIRNPLSAISHSAQLLSESNSIPKSDTKLLDIIQRHCIRMNKIVDNVLGLSKRKNANPELLESENWLEKFSLSLPENCTSNTNIHIYVKTPLTMQFDTSHLEQILTNLVENATHYGKNKTGNTELFLIMINDEKSGRPILDIQDNGPGISNQNISALFEPFFTTSNRGTGLGLYLSKELCEINHAQLVYITNQEERILSTNIGDPNIQDILDNYFTEQSKGACFRIYFAHNEKNISQHVLNDSKEIDIPKRK